MSRKNKPEANNLRDSAIDFLRRKNVLGPDNTEWIIKYSDGHQLSINDMLIDFAIEQMSPLLAVSNN
jgi:hypothetical protein